MVALALVRQWLQQAATELGEDLTADTVLTLEEEDGPASTQMGHALRLTASTFNSLSEKQRKEAVSMLWGNKATLVEKLNREYPPCLGSLFKGDVENAMSNSFDRKQYFTKLSWERAQGSGHAFPLTTTGEVTGWSQPATWAS